MKPKLKDTFMQLTLFMIWVYLALGLTFLFMFLSGEEIHPLIIMLIVLPTLLLSIMFIPIILVDIIKQIYYDSTEKKYGGND